MWFDARRALAEIVSDENPASASSTGAKRANRANPPPTEPHRLARLARLARPELPNPETAAPLSTPEDRQHGLSVAGRPRTWTGRVVSIDEYRRLSDWQRHGPNGRIWDGSTQTWVVPEDSA